MRFAVLGLAVASLAWTSTAAANPDIAGYSGKEYNGASAVCTTACHAKGVTPAPTLEITAPSTIKAGAKGEVTVVVNGTRKATLINAAFTTGVVSTAGQNTTIPFPDDQPDEVSSGKAITGATATYTFSFVPPNKNGPITLYVTGMSTDLGGNTNGDAIKSETRTITVTDATATPADAGASSSSSSSSSSGSTTKQRDAGATDDDDATNGARTRLPVEDEGCNTATGKLDASAALFALAVAVALLGSRRRR